MFFCQSCKISTNAFFTKHLRMTASILQIIKTNFLEGITYAWNLELLILKHLQTIDTSSCWYLSYLQLLAILIALSCNTLSETICFFINIKNFKNRLYNLNISCHFFGGATPKHSHHYFCPILNKTDVITDIAVLHMGTNDIINSEFNKDLEADSIINIAR